MLFGFFIKLSDCHIKQFNYIVYCGLALFFFLILHQNILILVFYGSCGLNNIK